MKLRDYKILLLLIFSSYSFSQNKISGIVSENEIGIALENVSIYDNERGLITKTDDLGYYELITEKEKITLVFFTEGYSPIQRTIKVDKDVKLDISFSISFLELPEVIIKANKEKIFELSKLRDVEGTSIYAGKKSEVISMDLSMANLASNNSRQIYSQIAGLNIYQNDDAGLQLNIGGRGLDPNRSSNFNTRQNGYDISADALGYPESYYTPPAEALKEIQIVRGAASLQYGTQFGGLVNFILNDPVRNKTFELISRNSIGSNSLFTNFTSFSGTSKKISYYSFVNFKKGNGFRPNSDFESFNTFLNIRYQFSEKSTLSGELTYLNYLAHQAGGLSDKMFYSDPFQSNRSRNWFGLNWFLYNLKFNHEFQTGTNFSFNFFGLNASRDALGFRTNRVDQIDSDNERDLIKGEFQNLGFESRFLHRYSLKDKNNVFLIGFRFYKSNNDSQQGPGSANSDADFNFKLDDFPNYNNQSKYNYPNLNYSVFAENIFYLSDKLSLTPGFRFEHIKTQSKGFYKKINLDAAGNVILNKTVFDDEIRKRNFLLLGLGISYKSSKSFEFYTNFSQNYRSVTFADISISNPAYSISPNISDENGSTFDFGFRGNYRKKFTYDIGFFTLLYKDRIGFVQKAFKDGSVKSEKGNVGNATMYGIESLLNFNLSNIFINDKNYSFNYFINSSIINSKYTSSVVPGVEGNNVEFVPKLNVKTGFKFGYKDLMFNIQYTYLSNQFTDASNAIESNLSGLIGEIPKYDILDVSTSYFYKKFKVETGINNVLDNHYFTRRATGYPGPGIIPSEPRSVYLTVQVKI
jgi:Fe(3+) dicitrate transport protein